MSFILTKSFVKILFLFSFLLVHLHLIAIAQDHVNEEFHNRKSRITGGYLASENPLLKYIISLREIKDDDIFGQGHFCAGAIISPHVILTAAHCVIDSVRKITMPHSKFIVVAGSKNRFQRTSSTQEVKVKKIHRHKHFSHSNNTNDIALLILESDIDVDGKTKDVIAIADTPPIIGSNCTILGWGKLYNYGPSPAEALYVDVQIYPQYVCAKFTPFLHEGTLCAGNLYDYEKGSCSGDSGGPLICESKIMGIVSYGPECMPGLPGFYTNVWYYRDWIRVNAGFRCKMTNAIHGLLIVATIWNYM